MNKNQDNINYWLGVYQNTNSHLDYLTYKYHFLLRESLACKEVKTAHLSATYEAEKNVENHKEEGNKKLYTTIPEIHQDSWRFLNGLLNFYENDACENCKIVMKKSGIPFKILYEAYIQFSHKYDLETQYEGKQWFINQFRAIIHKIPLSVGKRKKVYMNYTFHNFGDIKSKLQKELSLYDAEIRICDLKVGIWNKPCDT